VVRPVVTRFKHFHGTVFQLQPGLGCRDSVDCKPCRRRKAGSSASTMAAASDDSTLINDVWPFDGFRRSFQTVHQAVLSHNGRSDVGSNTGAKANANANAHTHAHASSTSAPSTPATAAPAATARAHLSPSKTTRAPVSTVVLKPSPHDLPTPPQLYGCRWRQATRELCSMTAQTVCRFAIVSQPWDAEHELASSDEDVCGVQVCSTTPGSKDACVGAAFAQLLLSLSLLVVVSLHDQPDPCVHVCTGGYVAFVLLVRSYRLSREARCSLGITLLLAHHRYWLSRWGRDAAGAWSSRQRPPASVAAAHRFPLHYALMHYLLMFKPSSPTVHEAEVIAMANFFSGLVRVGVFSHDAYVWVCVCVCVVYRACEALLCKESLCGAHLKCRVRRVRAK